MTFRTRIFSISICTVSAVLAIVITLGWSRIMEVELEHLDARLCMEAKRMVPRPNADQPMFSGNRLIFDLVDKLRISSADQLMILVNSSDNKPLIQSEGFNANRLIEVFSGAQQSETLLESQQVSRAYPLCQFISFQHNGVQWRASLYQAPQVKASQASTSQVSSPLASISQAKISQQGTAQVEPSQELSFQQQSPQQLSLQRLLHQDTASPALPQTTPYVNSYIAVDIAATTSELKNTLETALIFIIPFSLLLSILGAWFIATNTIRPINRLQKSMDKVTQKDLSHRLPESKQDQEFKRLIDTYNTMLERLEQSFQQTSRFTADAAHELKTPLTVLRGKLEQAVINDDQAQVDLNAILDEVGHLSAITRKLLLLSQADAGCMALHLEQINLTDLLDELTADMELLSEELVLNCAIERELIVKADTTLLRQLLNNLLTNAIRYSIQPKGVTLIANRTQLGVEVVISNFCPPMSETVRDQLFERFYRGDLEHTQGISGSGLGLSLAREIARAHGGELVLLPSQTDTVAMRLIIPS